MELSQTSMVYVPTSKSSIKLKLIMNILYI